MPRQPRVILPGYPHHVIQRGNNRDIIFASDADYLVYLEKLGDACRRHGCRVHAYVLMTNHVHLLMTPETQTGLSRAMQSLGRYYVQYFNYLYKRTGTLWEGRFKATLVDTDNYLLSCYRYIEENPVRAAMVASPADYRWSSYRHNAFGAPDALVSAHEGYLALGSTLADRQRAYRGLFDDSLNEETLSDIRETTNKGWVLGNDRFRERIEAMAKRQTAPKPRGGDRKSAKFKQRCQINRI